MAKWIKRLLCNLCFDRPGSILTQALLFFVEFDCLTLDMDLWDRKRVCYQLSYPCLCWLNKLWNNCCCLYQSFPRKKRVGQGLRNNFELNGMLRHAVVSTVSTVGSGLLFARFPTVEYLPTIKLSSDVINCRRKKRENKLTLSTAFSAFCL